MQLKYMNPTGKNYLQCLPAASTPVSRADFLISRYVVPAVRDKDTILGKLLRNIEEGGQNPRRIRLVSFNPAYRMAISAAASLVLILLLHFLLSVTSMENDSLHVQVIRLPDHSRVILNSNSTMSYPKYWWKKEVRLQGDAYFEVNKGNKLTIKTSEGKINVLGTRFQISETGGGIVVNCFEGAVGLSRGEELQRIPAGYSFEDDKIVLLQTDYPEMAQFRRTFSSEELSGVLTALEDFFQISIRLEIPHPLHFSGNLETAEAETAIRIVCRSLDLDYAFHSTKCVITNKKTKS